MKRGDWIVAPPIALATDRFDARLTLLADEPKALRSGAIVHVHLGAAHVSARLMLLDAKACPQTDRDELVPGTERLVQLVLQAPIAAWHGDRFIVRDPSATRTIGGGRVLDPFAPARYRRSPERLGVLAALEAETPEAQLKALVASATLGVDLKRFARAGNVRHLDPLVHPLAARRITSDTIDFLISADRWRALQRRAEEVLATFHAAHPDELGPDATRLKRMALPRLDDALYRALVADLIAAAKIKQGGPWLHLPGHSNAPSPQERALVEKLLPRLLDSPFDPPWVRDLAKSVAQPEALVRTAMFRASKRGEIFAFRS